MKNRSLNSRLAYVPHESVRVPGADELTAGAGFGFNISDVYGELGFLLSWSLQVPDLFN